MMERPGHITLEPSLIYSIYRQRHILTQKTAPIPVHYELAGYHRSGGTEVEIVRPVSLDGIVYYPRIPVTAARRDDLAQELFYNAIRWFASEQFAALTAAHGPMIYSGGIWKTAVEVGVHGDKFAVIIGSRPDYWYSGLFSRDGTIKVACYFEQMELNQESQIDRWRYYRTLGGGLMRHFDDIDNDASGFPTSPYSG